MSFILDALRKSEHERQRSTLPGLSQVPLATPPAQLPRWALVVIGVLAAGVLVLGGAWWQSTRAPTETTAAAPMIERSVDLPPPAAAFTPPRLTPPAPSQSAPARPPVEDNVATPNQTAPRPPLERAWRSTPPESSFAATANQPALPSPRRWPRRYRNTRRCASNCTPSAHTRATASYSSMAASTSRATG